MIMQQQPVGCLQVFRIRPRWPAALDQAQLVSDFLHLQFGFAQLLQLLPQLRLEHLQFRLILVGHDPLLIVVQQLHIPQPRLGV